MGSMRLLREIRFSLGVDEPGPIDNPFAGWPTAVGIQPYLVLRVAIAGAVDRTTGYLINITHIDRLLRERAIPLIRRMTAAAGPTGESLLRQVAADLAGCAAAGTRWLEWRLEVTPYLSYSLDTKEPEMVRLTQCFEFSASHRLHCPTMSDAENRDYFGKCNNPNGHGHNYQLEVTVAGRLGPSGAVLPLPALERTVRERVVDRFDHKHLNSDCPEFARLNPSVENIAKVAWGLLEGQFGDARLARVRVWETSKTCAEYQGED